MTDVILSEVDVVPALPMHLPWVFSTFREQAARLPMISRHEAHELADALLRVVRGPGRCAVAVFRGEPDAPAGWSASLDGAILFGYVRSPFRRHGIGSQMVASLTNSCPAHLAFWTDDADAIQRHGVAIEYDIHAFRALCTFVRQPGRPHQHRKAA